MVTVVVALCNGAIIRADGRVVVLNDARLPEPRSEVAGVPDNAVISDRKVFAAVGDETGALGSSNDVILTLVKGVVLKDEGVAVGLGGGCDSVMLFKLLVGTYQLLSKEGGSLYQRDLPHLL